MRLREAASDRNRVESSDISDFAYLFTGLITITQSCLVHLILQGVEHTDPTEWSNSHLFHKRQIHADCSTNSQFSKAAHSFSFRQWFSIYPRIFHFEMAPQHFTTAPQHFILRRLCNISFWDGSATFHCLQLYGIHTKMVVTIRTHYNGLFSNSTVYIAIYFNWYKTTQYITQIRHKKELLV